MLTFTISFPFCGKKMCSVGNELGMSGMRMKKVGEGAEKGVWAKGRRFKDDKSSVEIGTNGPSGVTRSGLLTS